MDKISLIQPPDYVVDMFYVLNRMNPSIAVWHNHTLCGWTILKYSIEDDDSFQLGWMNETTFSVDENINLFGINSSTTIKSYPFNRRKEDPRLLVLKDNSLLISYTAKASLFSTIMQCFIRATLNPITNTVEFKDTWLMYDQERNLTGKNWIPMQHKHRLMFIVHINPMIVLEVVGKGEGHKAITKVVSNSSFVNLPWDPEFGDEIRGGTPAVLVRGVYLSFFHTVQLHERYRLRSYYMGAMTLCPDHPFNILSMSSFPIIDKGWNLYQNQWLGRGMDYVVFPTGIVVDETETFVFVSFGHQDKHAGVMKMNITTLLDSLTYVSGCAMSSHRQHSNRILN